MFRIKKQSDRNTDFHFMSRKKRAGEGLSYLKRVLYRPYPSFSRSSLGMNLSAAEFMQYLSPVGFGPSLNRCPRWESACLLLTSVLAVKRPLSSRSTMFPGSSGLVKLGHPVPESYLSVELKSGSPETMSIIYPFPMVVPVLVLKSRLSSALLGDLVLERRKPLP